MTELQQLDWKGIPGLVTKQRNARMQQWEKLNYGMFIHWGLYSAIGGKWNGEPVTKGYSEQIQMWANISEEDYLQVAKEFNADQFDADEICLLAKKAGMKYVLMTTKHHDGFCMFDTKTTDYNIVQQTPYGKDPLKLLSEACARHGLEFGIYYSLVDWHQGHPFDENNNNPIPAHIEDIIEAQLVELLTNYGDICEIWFDMSSPTIQQSEKFIEIVRKYQPNAAINSRIWNNMGDFRTLDDNEVPSVILDGPWQTPASIYRETWGYRAWQVREDLTGKVKELLKAFVGDGNYLLNIGPHGDGSIVPFEAEVLSAIGEWITRHPQLKEAQATLFDKPRWGKVKANEGKLYLVVEDVPADGKIVLNGLLNNVTKVIEDGTSHELQWEKEDLALTITLPETFKEEVLPVIVLDIVGDLQIIPEHTINLQAENTSIQTEQLYTGHGYHEKGNYNSMQQVIVRYSGYLRKETAGTVDLSFEGQADPNQQYRIALGSEEKIVSGTQINAKEAISFALKGNQVEELRITLANPVHDGEPIAFALESIHVSIN